MQYISQSINHHISIGAVLVQCNRTWATNSLSCPQLHRGLCEIPVLKPVFSTTHWYRVCDSMLVKISRQYSHLIQVSTRLI